MCVFFIQLLYSFKFNDSVSMYNLDILGDPSFKECLSSMSASSYFCI